jgi:hypothetical protein
MPARQQAVHRIKEFDSESGAIPRYTVHSDAPILQGFYEAIPLLPQSCIHIITTQLREHPLIVPKARVWMNITFMTGDGLPVRSSHGLLP